MLTNLSNINLEQSAVVGGAQHPECLDEGAKADVPPVPFQGFSKLFIVGKLY